MGIVSQALGQNLFSKILSPGTVQSFLVVGLLAVIGLLTNDKVFQCPCDYALLYGLMFIFLPAVNIFLSVFPWNLLRHTKGYCNRWVICGMAKLPILYAVTWMIISLLDKDQLICLKVIYNTTTSDCTEDKTIWIYQLGSLLVWFLITLLFIGSTCCCSNCCKDARSRLRHITASYELGERMEKVMLKTDVGLKRENETSRTDRASSGNNQLETQQENNDKTGCRLCGLIFSIQRDQGTQGAEEVSWGTESERSALNNGAHNDTIHLVENPGYQTIPESTTSAARLVRTQSCTARESTTTLPAFSEQEIRDKAPGLTDGTTAILNWAGLLVKDILRNLKDSDLKELELPLSQKILLRALIDSGRLQENAIIPPGASEQQVY